LDIKVAYLKDKLDKEIYTIIPPGDTNFEKGYWKLNKFYMALNNLVDNGVLPSQLF